ncbi:MAG: hypothetical protein HYX51_08365 [Chloroflexi bacterium]|nr:hypothetical protein [Chloroflexota bacterium]
MSTTNRSRSGVREQSLHVWNSTPRPLSLFLEPWGEAYTLDPESGVDVVGEGPAEGRFEVSIQERGIAVYGWTGSVAHVLKDGEVLAPFAREPVDGAGGIR